ncbi:hypothetical protein [Bosea sp. (in: a-proteobacteria)]|uniref:hypothetical protein n=1 Tax=Bosea sp. (in: a-proteobacteria) TaxID=1871050 RepID=UPI003B3B5AAA
MGAAAPFAGPALAVAGAGMQIAGGISEGIAKKTAAQVETVRLKMAAEAGKVKALQTDAAFREEWNEVDQTIGSIRAGQNVEFDSPTAMALYGAARDRSDRARVQAVSNERLKALGLEGDAAAAWKRGEAARTSATLSASMGALSTLSKSFS